ncbi:hypothetical protein [Azospirillum argentinense]|uniref:Uncharacterized protein n=1 Tax=Azospirillum argentinense TaxID=2970906 RepID=A0A5B0KRJ2_9PROT|nr:hypothetical protein [Azospirillum argentinense]KAA1054200.1 hypothetical protein FH063_002102 [Azospirillum argentinense]
MANDQGPKKFGVYEAASAGGLNWTWIIVGLIVIAILLYFFLR